MGIFRSVGSANKSFELFSESVIILQNLESQKYHASQTWAGLCCTGVDQWHHCKISWSPHTITRFLVLCSKLLVIADNSLKLGTGLVGWQSHLDSFSKSSNCFDSEVLLHYLIMVLSLAYQMKRFFIVFLFSTNCSIINKVH